MLSTEAGDAVVGAMVPEQGPTTSQACCHAPPYAVENGSYPTWLQNVATPGDLHLKICAIPDASFIDTELPATYVAPSTHVLGHPVVGVVGLDVVGDFVGLAVGMEVGVFVGDSVGLSVGTVGLVVVGDLLKLAVGMDVVGESLWLADGLSVGVRVGLSVEHAPSNLMLLMWINWLPPN